VAQSQSNLIALAAGGGAAALVVIGIGVVVVRSFTSEPSRVPAGVAGEGAEVANEGRHARGTAELRQIGCETAIAIDMQRLLGSAKAVRDGEPRYIVTCDVTDAGAPTCERVAGTYFAALGGTADANVNVRVSVTGSIKPLCSRLYAPTGADLGLR
jgi:hypothetical protein